MMLGDMPTYFRSSRPRAAKEHECASVIGSSSSEMSTSWQ